MADQLPTQLRQRYPRTRAYLVVVCTLTFLLELIQFLAHMGTH
jgi:hypothetical protein